MCRPIELADRSHSHHLDSDIDQMDQVKLEIKDCKSNVELVTGAALKYVPS